MCACCRNGVGVFHQRDKLGGWCCGSHTKAQHLQLAVKTMNECLERLALHPFSKDRLHDAQRTHHIHQEEIQVYTPFLMEVVPGHNGSHPLHHAQTERIQSNLIQKVPQGLLLGTRIKNGFLYIRVLFINRQ